MERQLKIFGHLMRKDGLDFFFFLLTRQIEDKTVRVKKCGTYQARLSRQMIGAEFGRDGKEVEVIKNYKGHGIMESRDRQSPERKQRIEENNCICRDSEIFRIYIFSSQFFFLMLHCIKKNNFNCLWVVQL